MGMGGRGGGGVHLDKPLRLGVVKGWWGWQHELPGPGKRWGEAPPPPPPPPRNRGEDVRVGGQFGDLLWSSRALEGPSARGSVGTCIE